jgi:hypothetical protein
MAAARFHSSRTRYGVGASGGDAQTVMPAGIRSVVHEVDWEDERREYDTAATGPDGPGTDAGDPHQEIPLTADTALRVQPRHLLRSHEPNEHGSWQNPSCRQTGRHCVAQPVAGTVSDASRSDWHHQWTARLDARSRGL